jgi:hypothetical protein
MPTYKWERGPGIEPKWLILDENRVIVRQIIDRGPSYGQERFEVSGGGHFSKHPSHSKAEIEAEGSLTPEEVLRVRAAEGA